MESMTIYINGWYVLAGFVYLLISYACLAVVSESLPARLDLKHILFVPAFFLIGPLYMLFEAAKHGVRNGWEWLKLRVYPLQFASTWIKIKTGHFDYGRLSGPGFTDYWQKRVERDYAARPQALKGDLYLIRLLRSRIEQRAGRK